LSVPATTSNHTFAIAPNRSEHHIRWHLTFRGRQARIVRRLRRLAELRLQFRDPSFGRASSAPTTSVRIAGRTHWNWVFQNDQVVIHVVRDTRAASVVADVVADHRSTIWVSDLYGG
jgi:hypothetical protein